MPVNLTTLLPVLVIVILECNKFPRLSLTSRAELAGAQRRCARLVPQQPHDVLARLDDRLVWLTAGVPIDEPIVACFTMRSWLDPAVEVSRQAVEP